MIKIAILFAAFFNCFNSYADDSLLIETFEATKKNVCGNQVFLRCVEMPSVICDETLNRAFNECSPIYIERLDIEVFNAPCGADYLVENSKNPGSLFDTCSEKFLPKLQR